jgi:hypothetical protein
MFLTKTFQRTAAIVCDAARSPVPATTTGGDWHDASGHHRYYGSSALNGGERIVEARRGPRFFAVSLCGF